jgi:DNA polymerase
MENCDYDFRKAALQHIEMESTLSGGLVRRTELNTADDSSDASTVDIQSTERIVDEKVAQALDKLSEEVCKCTGCVLCKTRNKPVPGEGSYSARILFVGEAPGADEDAQGRPFVGRAGQLLDNIIGAMGLNRKDVYIGNILKCRPPDNRDPKPDEIISCLPYLQRQIELINPDIIVALGAHAARTLLNTNKPIGQLRGFFHDYPMGFERAPIKLMATYHPAYLLRNYSVDNRRRVWEDMKKVIEELGLPMPASKK